MSAVFDKKSPSIDSATLESLRTYLGRSFLKKQSTACNTASLAQTKNHSYFSGLMESRTHLLDIPSELGALVVATMNQDVHVTEVTTLVTGPFTLNPLVIKILADHVRRTGTSLTYRVIDEKGKLVHSSNPSVDYFYTPDPCPLTKILEWVPRVNRVLIRPEKPFPSQLREAVLNGLDCHFGTSDSATRYGAAVRAGNYLYFAGVYSSFDHRLNVHAEMAAALCAMMDTKEPVSWVGLASTKFMDTPCHMCGCCCQFFFEIQTKTNQPIQIAAFSLNQSEPQVISLHDYLPYAWHS